MHGITTKIEKKSVKIFQRIYNMTRNMENNEIAANQNVTHNG